MNNMSKRIITVVVALVMFVGPMCGVALALDENAEALGFLPSDAAMVMALDVNEILDYARDEGSGWRDADRAHFLEALTDVSNMLVASDSSFPHFVTLLGCLDGVQAFTMDPMTREAWLVVLTMRSEEALDASVVFLACSDIDSEFDSTVDQIVNALQEYRSDAEPEVDRATGIYPETLYDLVEEGYLDELPTNPYTGEPIRILSPDEEGSFGDICYEPLTEWGSGPTSFRLTANHITGRITQEGNHYYPTRCEPYTDFAGRLSRFLAEHSLDEYGYETQTDGEWTFLQLGYSGGVAFAYGETYFLISDSVDSLKNAIARHDSGEGFSFSTPADFDTDGAFYRDQTDSVRMQELSEEALGEMPGMAGMWSAMGIEAASFTHTACFLRDGEIVNTRRIYLTGESENSVLGSGLYAENEDLMTAQGGPFEIVSEMACANLDEAMHAYVDYVFEFLVPSFAELSGGYGPDVNEMLDMVGLGNIQDLDLGDQVYVLVTGSTERPGGVYAPGIIVLMRGASEDVPYTMVGFVDSLSLMSEDFPFSTGEFGDENAFTWVLNNEEFPISPTVAWTDEWVITSAWREDALDAREALENGTLFSPSGEPPAVVRMHCTRRELFRALADLSYEIGSATDDYGYGPSVSVVGAAFELLAQLTEPGESLSYEQVNTEEYAETTFSFSIDLFENLLRAAPYVVHGFAGYGGY